MDKECTSDCLRYPSEDFVDENGFPYCRWCGIYKQTSIDLANKILKEFKDKKNDR